MHPFEVGPGDLPQALAGEGQLLFDSSQLTWALGQLVLPQYKHRREEPKEAKEATDRIQAALEEDRRREEEAARRRHPLTDPPDGKPPLPPK